MNSKMLNALFLIVSCAIFTGSTSVFAHEGHGLEGSHWHPTDIWGFVTLGGMIAVGVWLSRGGK